MIFSIITSLLIIIIDQLLKFWVTSNMSLNTSLPLVPGVMDLFYIHNDGAGWGMFSGQIPIFVILTLLFVGYIIYLSYRNRFEDRYIHLIYGLLIGGGIGNLMDRLRLGYVIDMFRFEFVDFPIFNIADAALTLGVILMILVLIFRKDTDHIL